MWESSLLTSKASNLNCMGVWRRTKMGKGKASKLLLHPAMILTFVCLQFQAPLCVPLSLTEDKTISSATMQHGGETSQHQRFMSHYLLKRWHGKLEEWKCAWQRCIRMCMKVTSEHKSEMELRHSQDLGASSMHVCAVNGKTLRILISLQNWMWVISYSK